MTTERQAVKTLADAIAKATRVMIEDNNKRYVNNQIKNFSGGGGTASGSGGGGGGGPIPASQVTGLYNTVAGYIINAKTNADGGDPIAGRILTTLNGIADIQVGRATINSAQISDLKAGVANIIHLTTQSATIEDATIRQLKADISNVGLANIGTADIGFAQVKDLVAGTAIIREGAASKLYIDRLAVTDANIMSLTAGEIMLKDSNDNFVRLVIDGTTGEITTETVTFDGDDVLNSNSLNANKIIEHSITARELNVESIFADSALIGAITADNIDVTTLFAKDAFLQGIYTNTIQAANAGRDIDISQNSSITLLNGKIGLIVEDGSTSSSITLTPGMIEAVGDVVDIKADTIDLSANQSITAKVRSEIEEVIYYRMDMFSTSDTLSDKVASSTLSVNVYKGNENITSTSSASCFKWTRISQDASGDAVWNAASTHSGVKTITITSDDVLYNAVFQCDFILNNTVMASASRDILDMSEGRTMYASVSSNLPTTQILNSNTNAYTPDWSSSNLILTPVVLLNDTSIEYTDSNLSVVWMRKLSSGTETALSSGEMQSGNRLYVTANVLSQSGVNGLISYVAHVTYTNDDLSTITSTASMTFALVTTGQDGSSGDPGQDAIMLFVYAPNGTVFINNAGNLPIKASLYLGSEEVASGVTYVWQKYVSGRWQTITGATSDTYTVSGDSVIGSATFRCIASYQGSDYYNTISLTDKTENIQAIIESTGGNIFKNSTGSTTLTCRLFQNASEIDSSGSRYTCWWYKLDKDNQPTDWSDGDVRKAGKQITISESEIDEKTTFICEVIDQTLELDDQLKASAQFTIIDLNDPVLSGEEPVSPVVDMLWIDTSVTPNEMMRWDGNEWVSVSNIDKEELDTRLTIVETSITEQEGEIELRATKEKVQQVEGRVASNELEIAQINVRYDDISLAVGKKSSNYRQTTQPEDPNIGDIWIVPVTSGSLAGSEKTYQAYGAIGSAAPEFAFDDDGNLLYKYDDSVPLENEYLIDVSQDGDLEIQADGYYYISADGEFIAGAEWKEIKSDGLAALEITVNGINSRVVGLDNTVSAVSQQAGKIDWIIASGTSAANMQLTSDALSAIANNINLHGNNTVYISSDDQISATARGNMDLSANESIVIYSGDQITVEAASEIDLTSNDTIRLQSETIELISTRVSEAESDIADVNNSIVAIVEVTDNVSNWFTFGQDGLVIQKTNSKWSTRISDNGYYIDNEDVGHVEAFYKEEAHFRSIKVTKKAGQQSTDIRVRPTATGGWVWSD